MNDDIFDGTNAPAATPPAAPPPTPASAPPDDGRVERLEATVNKLVGTLTDLANQPAPVPAAPPAPRPSPGDLLSELASDPEKVVSRIAQETADRVVNQNLAPVVMQTLDVAAQQLLNGHANQVDAQFGAGTWDEMFRPQLEQDLARLKGVNPRALADPGTVEALVNRLYGGANFTKLIDRRDAHKTALSETEKAGIQKIISHLPQGGVPRLRGAGGNDEIPADVEQFIRETDAATGTTTDRKAFARLYNTGSDTGRGHRTDVLQYLEAVGASPDTLKAHGKQ